jgi:hypothetical protein
MARRFRHETIKDRLPVPTRVTKLGCDRLEGAFRQPPGNFPKRGTAWWGWKDSNHAPDGYQRGISDSDITKEERVAGATAMQMPSRKIVLHGTLFGDKIVLISPGLWCARRDSNS